MAHRKSPYRRKPRSNPHGTLQVHPEGYAFAVTAEGDFFIPANRLNGAFDGDVVELAPTGRRANGGKPAARILRVLGRAHESIIGRYEVAEPFGVVIPEDPHITYDVFTQRAAAPNVPDGSLVRVQIDAYPSRNEACTGHVVEVLGFGDEVDVGVELIIARHKLQTEFPPAALDEARACSLDVEGALRQGYEDIRDRVVFTIDPADARDFDDAVSIEPLQPANATAGWRIGVHIADVSAYVPWDGSLDSEARRRATSVYLVDRVIPMLPEHLSNGLCSLVPHEPRLALSVDIDIDERANVRGFRFYPGVIESKRRYTYDEALSIMESGDERTFVPGACTEDALAARLRLLGDIARVREAQRIERGGIEFNTVEARVKLDGQGRAEGVDLRRKTPATSLIEECMIMANECAARFLSDAGHPSVYRVHERPAADALAHLAAVFGEFPWFKRLDSDRLALGDPHAINDALRLAQGRLEEELVNMLVVRSMARAIYRTSNDGHYGLASEAYAHFTSPIRRYPDLIVHRMVKEQLAGKTGKHVRELEYIARHASEMERVADAAAAQSQEYKLIEYLQSFVGQRFRGVISGVATYGIFVRLPNTAEGLIDTRALGREYFAFNPTRHVLAGTETGVEYRLGMPIDVVVQEADPKRRRLSLGLR